MKIVKNKLCFLEVLTKTVFSHELEFIKYRDR